MGALDRVIHLFHHRWAVPILAAIQSRAGVRFVYLVNGLGIPRDTVSRTLNALIRMGLVRRNPGYGHPLRPEYILTRRGERLRAGCLALTTLVDRLAIGETAWRKWTMPIVAALGRSGGERRYSEIMGMLPDVVPRALALALRDMEAVGLIERRVIDEYPPTTRYRLAATGRKLARVLRTLVMQL